MSDRWIRATAVVLSFLATSCVQVPPHDGAARVPLGSVTKLVKCDIYRTIALELAEHPTQIAQIEFLAQWAAKVHLTVYVDDTIAISPGATLIQPLAVANTSYSTGIGAAFTTEAVRQEDIEFFLSFQELSKEFRQLGRKGIEQKYNSCAPGDGILLESDLGLKDVVDTALRPVLDGTLKAGGNIGPSTTTVAALQGAKSNLNDFKTNVFAQPVSNVADLETYLKTNHREGQFSALVKSLPSEQQENAKKGAASDIEQLGKLDKDAKELVTNVVTPVYDTLSPTLPKKCLDDTPGKADKPKDKKPGITSNKDSAVLSASLVSMAKLNGDGATDPSVLATALKNAKSAEADAIKYAQNMIDQINVCLKNPPKDEKPLYDPIDVITETVDFYITYSGSVTPTWKLVKVSAPLAPTFLLGTRKDTNTLIVSMGRPDTKAGVATGPSATMNQQIASALLGQAVLTLPRP